KHQMILYRLRTSLITFLKSRSIGCVFHYIPLHTAPAGQKYGRFSGEDRYTTKESERLARLPMYYGLGTDAVEEICDVIKEFYR
ncbi:MAG: DegT/DnrJ/EryC1/StrS family aminotransferase, partial [Lachnospiraceae bacterium]|nr:DegT/DnrJ/EryC1/StrS family aminotransferase [Lachnospiraceae bacterium]